MVILTSGTYSMTTPNLQTACDTASTVPRSALFRMKKWRWRDMGIFCTFLRLHKVLYCSAFILKKGIRIVHPDSFLDDSLPKKYVLS